MPHRNDDRIDDLLAGGRLGGPARDRVLGRVLGALPGAAPSGGRRVLRFALGTVFAGGVLAAVLIARPRGGAEDAMRTKGAGAGLRATSVTALCARPDGICRVGDRLMFRVDAPVDRAFLLAYADPLDETGHRKDGRVWIFPTASGESAEVVPAAEPYVLRRAVEIDSSLPRGRYRLTLILSKRRVSREEALTATDVVRTASTLEIE